MNQSVMSCFSVYSLSKGQTTPTDLIVLLALGVNLLVLRLICFRVDYTMVSTRLQSKMFSTESLDEAELISSDSDLSDFNSGTCARDSWLNFGSLLTFCAFSWMNPFCSKQWLSWYSSKLPLILDRYPLERLFPEGLFEVLLFLPLDGSIYAWPPSFCLERILNNETVIGVPLMPSLYDSSGWASSIRFVCSTFISCRRFIWLLLLSWLLFWVWTVSRDVCF